MISLAETADLSIFCHLSGVELWWQQEQFSVNVHYPKEDAGLTWCVFSSRVDNSGICRLKPGLRKYYCELTLDSNTALRKVKLSDDNRKVTAVEEEQPYPDHPDRFNHWGQILCETGLTGCCYWEVKWEGWVDIGVTYRRIKRKGNGADCRLGGNDQSWVLDCSDEGFIVCHKNSGTSVRPPASSSNRVGVYLDWPAGTLSFYSVCSDTQIHLHTINTTFTEPVYPAFRIRDKSFGASLSLCRL
ncbi:stonustoxin subunit beta-like [Seriola lalandi dorsalis]|uniref:stonustoxin subunit beta-like n=1 Tax=Seriola lalandi dorsalis TaxID=1841481 RepID=UPI000C6FBF46|nr:stonustoxin subunit beta-like [Seriola lalandi dorsalis]